MYLSFTIKGLAYKSVVLGLTVIELDSSLIT
jgi:hypothetical protein